MRDTTGPADERYHELLRAQLPHQRLQTAMSLSRAVRELAEAGIRERHPLADAAEVRVRLVVRLYGRDVAARLFRSVPDDAV
jgi:DNA-binding HxlR family transcriptional regulator